MPRLIDADALKRDVKRWFASTANRERMKGALDSAPTIEAEPVRHSCWTRHRECHECGELALYNGNEELVRSRFCPHCGAKMDEKEEK